MPAIQPIPQNTPDPAKQEATAVLAKHNSSTDSRKRTPAAWAPSVRRYTVSGQNSGTRKAK